jgi:hypothetical protein
MLEYWYGALAVELKPDAQAPALLERPPAAALANPLAAEKARHWYRWCRAVLDGRLL